MKNFMKYGILLFCLVTLLFTESAWAAPSQKQIKAMSLFLSNFTELGFMNVSTEEMAQPDSYPDLVNFGVWHNYMNNFKSRIEVNSKKLEKRGDLRIKKRWVEDSVRKYFGLKIKADRSVDQSDPPYYFKKGYFYFWGADGEAVYYARVKKASSTQKGIWKLSGYIYNADDPQELYGNFNATVKEAMWGKKHTYVMVSMSSEYKPSN